MDGSRGVFESITENVDYLSGHVRKSACEVRTGVRLDGRYL